MNSVAHNQGVAILDIHDGRWALWQVSVDTFTGPLRASATNAVTSDGFDENAFRSLSGGRQLFLTARAEEKCVEPQVLQAPRFDPEAFIADCRSWVNLLQDLFWAENERRSAYNEGRVQERKAARAAGLPVPDYKRQAPLLDIDWPAPPLSSAWESDQDCSEPVSVEALRIANGCIRLLNYWLEIETDRTRRTRTYFEGIGGARVRAWPVPAPEASHV